MFSAERFIAGSLDFARRVFFRGRVVGNHVLHTKYGEITLKNFAFIESASNSGMSIDVEVFKRGLASHNLVVAGIKIPPNISIGIHHYYGPYFLMLDNQEVIVNNIPFSVGNISSGNLRDSRFLPARDADIAIFGVRFVNEYIMLEDSTYLNVAKMRGPLLIYVDNELWKFVPYDDAFLMVKRPEEAEFTRYKSITFRQNWGEFIEGELWEQ